MQGIILILIIIIAGFLIYRLKKIRKKNKIAAYKLPTTAADILQQYVPFYINLTSEEQVEFRERIRDFLARTVITGVGDTIVDDTDRILVACSAIIPIFRFKGWRYNNISEVLLYGGSFRKDYDMEAKDRNILGMVGDGALHRQMILSKPALRHGFMAGEDQHNTGIHEFVHLLDKADGATDGVPEYLLGKEHLVPWLREMHRQIKLIKTEGSDINPYAATNEAEFLAVTATYFFEKPEQLHQQHPELYRLLDLMFHPRQEK